MGNKTDLKLLILALLFLCATIPVYAWNDSTRQQPKPPLRSFFEHFDGVTMERTIDLAESAEKMLNLDDYLFADFNTPQGLVNLYIGYYYSANKAYASHSPTICYPSQGWKIDGKPVNRSMQVGPHTIHYKEIITSLGDRRELVLYWYQARLRTNTQVYRNKIDMGYNKLVHNDDDHGFIRVAVPFNGKTREQTQQSAEAFLKTLYPHLAGFLTK